MAYDYREESETESTPVALLSKLEKQAATNKILMIAVIAISVMFIAVMATGLTVMLHRVSVLTEASQLKDNDPISQQFIALEQQLMLLTDFRSNELDKITAYTRQLNQLTNNCSAEKMLDYQDFLISREQDLQKLINAIKSGSSNLAAMNQGSKKWLDVYNQSLDELKDQSVQRKAKLDKLVERSN